MRTIKLKPGMSITLECAAPRAVKKAAIKKTVKKTAKKEPSEKVSAFEKKVRSLEAGEIHYVPSVVSARSKDAQKAALLVMHREGKIQLRPEGGIGRLSPKDSELCPTGAGGIPLSWFTVLLPLEKKSRKETITASDILKAKR